MSRQFLILGLNFRAHPHLPLLFLSEEAQALSGAGEGCWELERPLDSPLLWVVRSTPTSHGWFPVPHPPWTFPDGAQALPSLPRKGLLASSGPSTDISLSLLSPWCLVWESWSPQKTSVLRDTLPQVTLCQHFAGTSFVR